MLKNEIETLKEENKNYKTRYEWERSINKKSDEKIKRRKGQKMWQTETRQTEKHQSRQNVSLETGNRFAAL